MALNAEETEGWSPADFRMDSASAWVLAVTSGISMSSWPPDTMMLMALPMRSSAFGGGV